jgi:hypothetical protein
MSENTTTDHCASASHKTVRLLDGFVMSPTRIPSAVVVPTVGVTGSETGNGEGEELSMTSDVLALRGGWWICRRTMLGSRYDHVGVGA